MNAQIKNVLISNFYDIEFKVFLDLHQNKKLNLVGVLVQNPFDNFYQVPLKSIFPSNVQCVFSNELIHNFLKRDYASKFEFRVHEDLSAYDWAKDCFMNQVDRIDIFKNFTKFDRIRLFKNLISFWSHFIEINKINLVYFSLVPHEVVDYALYVVCKNKKIKTLMFIDNDLLGRKMLVDDFIAPWKIDNKIIEVASTLNFNNDSIHNILNVVKSQIIKNTRLDIPWILKDDISRKKVFTKIIIFFKMTKSKITLMSKIFYKEPFYSTINPLIIASKFPRFTRFINNFENLLQSKSNYVQHRRLYNYINLQTQENTFIPENAVVFYLSYQPEMLVNPMGGRFYDQIDAIEYIANNLPPNLNLYIREHPLQFNSEFNYGHLGRDKSFYEKIKNISNVSFIASELDLVHDLDLRPKFIVTISGSIGWEASVMGIPVILLGNAWYFGAPGTERPKDHTQLKNLLQSEYGEVWRSKSSKQRYLLFKEYLEDYANKSFEFCFSEESANRIGKRFNDQKVSRDLYFLLLNLF